MITNPFRSKKKKDAEVQLEELNLMLRNYYANLLNTPELPYDNIADNLKEFCKRINNRYAEELTNTNADLFALQSQINPHFLYNTLDSIRGQAVRYKVYEIADMTKALSSIFRYTISKKDLFVTLRDELWNISTYFKIQQFRFNNRFSLNMHGDTEALDYFIPKLILQPLVENAIFHGLELKTEPGHISIRYAATEKRLIITVSDDGVGMSTETLDRIRSSISGEYILEPHASHSGIALRNINQRIHLLYGKEYGLSVYSIENSGTDMEITLPIRLTGETPHPASVPAGPVSGTETRTSETEVQTGSAVIRTDAAGVPAAGADEIPDAAETRKDV